MGDRDLAQSAAGGSGAAYAQILDRYTDALYRYAYALTRDRGDADELAEEALLRAWRTLADARLVTESLAPWLLDTCRSVHAGWLRGRGRRARPPREEELLLGAWRDEDDAEETLDWILDGLSGLDEADRRLIETCLLRDVSYRRAALTAGLRPTAARRIRPVRPPSGADDVQQARAS